MFDCGLRVRTNRVEVTGCEIRLNVCAHATKSKIHATSTSRYSRTEQLQLGGEKRSELADSELHVARDSRYGGVAADGPSVLHLIIDHRAARCEL